MQIKISLLIAALCAFRINYVKAEDLYDVLGVSKGASTQEIKAAYKKLAREWHPDKNKSPEATDRFTKINEAYETLGEAEKRRNYDNFGYTTAQERPQRQHHDFGFPFDDFFGGHTFTFGGFGGGGFGNRAESVVDKHLTTLRNFESKLQPESYRTPCFMYVFSNFCFNCMRMEHLLEKFFEELESVGLCVATVHMNHSPDLASHLRVFSAPALLGLINGRVTHLKADAISLHSLREFVRQLFPKDILTRLKDSDADTFLQGWQNNQVTALFFSPRTEPSARFLAPAFLHRHRVAFAYVCTARDDAQLLMHRLNINRRRETLLMFNEETSSPVATISMQQLPRSTMEEVISGNRFLLLPRLSSQNVFEELCPKEAKIKRRKLCVALVTNKGPEHDHAREKFRQFAVATGSFLHPERVRFVYLFEEVQQKVMDVLTKGNSTRTTNVLEVAIMWHQDNRRVSYEFLEQGWSLRDDHLDASREALRRRLTELLDSDHLLPYKAVMPDFYNEHALNLLSRMFYKMLDWGDRIWFFFAGYHPQTYFMVGMSIVMLAVMGLVIKKMNDAEEAQIKKQMKTRLKQPRPPSSTPDNQTIHLYELRYETFSNLVKEADTGLTIVLLVDEDCKQQLMTQFAQIMQPYSRYSGLTFGFLQLEYYISWYQHLLEQSINFKVKLNSINIRNCIGTVLALNGYRKYYYIYHPRNAQRWIRRQSRVGQAMGFMDSESDSDEASAANPNPSSEDEKIFLNETLSGLSMWMDRVFDGSVRKVRIDYWPEMSL